MTRLRSSRQATEPAGSSTSSTGILTPSTESGFNFTPSVTDQSDVGTPRTSANGLSGLPSSSANRGTVDLADEFRQIALLDGGGNLDLNDLGIALDNISTPRGSQPESRRFVTRDNSEHLSPPPPATRRRSSSRTRQPPHDVTSEEPPNDRFYEPSFQSAYSDTKNCVEELKTVLESTALHLQNGSTIERIYHKTSELASFTSPTKRVVGFVGDSGVGKSSLLNALLDFRSLARSSNSGAACTCVATEYRYHERDDFVVEADMFSSEELDSMLKDMLHAFRHYEFNGDDLTREERVEDEKRHELAWNTLNAMFQDHLKGQSHSLTAHSEDAVLETLRHWVRETNIGNLGGRKVLASLTECSDHLVRLTSDPNSAQEFAVWPYIKHLRVYCRAHVLSKGLVFADLPGLRDINSARRNNTERYLLRCDEVFAIAGIGRATSDEGVKSVIDLAKRAGLSNVGIICTKSDDIKAHEASTDWDEAKARHIRRLQDAVDTSEDEISRVDEELRNYDDDDLEIEEREYAHRLTRRRAHLSQEKDARVFELKRYLIDTRNQIITRKLHDLYRNEVPGGQLKVACVSNDDYWKKRDLPQDESRSLLNLSGIIRLRKHCISIVSESKYHAASKYMQHDVAALLGDIELWIQAGAPSLDVEQKQQIREAVDVVERRLKKKLLGHRSQLKEFGLRVNEDFEELIFGPNTNTERWCARASDAAADWSTWHHASYAAFCRQYGDYCTSAVGTRNWNEEAIHGMAQDLTQPWRVLIRRIASKERERINLLQETIMSASDYLGSAIHESTSLPDTLVLALTSRHSIMNTELERVAEVLRLELRALKTDLLSGIRTSYIGQALESAYLACNRECGNGSHQRRKAIMNRKLSEDELFEDILERTERQFKAAVSSTETDIQVVLRAQFDDLKATFDIVRNDNAISEGEQDPVFRVRIQNALESCRKTAERHQAVLEGIQT